MVQSIEISNVLKYLQAMHMPFFLTQFPTDASLDISWGVDCEKLPQTPRQFMDMLVEIDYTSQVFLPN